MDKVLDQLLNVDLIPIVTHPERNPILRKDAAKLEGWVGAGVHRVQVTALSILGGFGKQAQAAARQLMQKGLAHVIASDAHDPVHRHPKLRRGLRRGFRRFRGRDGGTAVRDESGTDYPRWVRGDGTARGDRDAPQVVAVVGRGP